MGGESFFDKIKMLLSGGGGEPVPEPTPMPGKPWEQPMMGQPMMERPMPMASPSPPPVGPPGSDIEMQVRNLIKQREIAKRLAPEGAWNTPQQ